MFLKILVELPKPYIPKGKQKSLLHAIGCDWYMTKLNQKLPPLNEIILRKNSQEKEDEIKIKLHKANQYQNYWKF